MVCGFRKMSLEDRRKWKQKMYNFWEDNLEERLAGVRAAKAKLEEQIARDTVNTTETGTSPLDE